MRSVLVDWLVEVHQQFSLLQETLFLAVAILDRYEYIYKSNMFVKGENYSTLTTSSCQNYNIILLIDTCRNELIKSPAKSSNLSE